MACSQKKKERDSSATLGNPWRESNIRLEISYQRILLILKLCEIPGEDRTFRWKPPIKRNLFWHLLAPFQKKKSSLTKINIFFFLNVTMRGCVSKKKKKKQGETKKFSILKRCEIPDEDRFP
jgi:hypothetical protein